MASRRFNQFCYTFEQFLVNLLGSFTQSGSTGTFATLVDNGITYTAVTMGTYGNGISVALVAGGTAGAEVVTVTDKAISVQIESGVSTRTQVKTALDASAAAVALISTSVASGATAATLLAATPLATGVNTVFTSVAKGFSLNQIGTGLFKVQLEDSYNALLAANVSIGRSSGAVDLMSQVKSASPQSSSLVFRVLAGATPTNLTSGDVLYCDFKFRNSGK